MRLTKNTLERFVSQKPMVRLQRWTGIPFPKLDTLIISAMRAEGEANLRMELNENTLRALGVYRHLNQRRSIDPQEFAALMHDLTPYASGKDEVPLFDQVFNQVSMFDTPLILDQSVFTLTGTDAATQKTLKQLRAGLPLLLTDDDLLLIARQTEGHLKALKRDLPTISSLYRQARVAQHFGYSIADLLTLTGLLGGQCYKKALASGLLNPPTQPAIPGTLRVPEDPEDPEVPHTPDILDVLMQLDWAVDWLNDSQQTVAQLQQRLGPDVPQAAVDERDDNPQIDALGPALPNDLLKRLARLHDDTGRSVVTEEQVAALELPAYHNASAPEEIKWFERLINQDLLDKDGLLLGLDRPLSLVDEPLAWLGTDLDELLEDLSLDSHGKKT
jgi:hypothetical protein